MTYLFIVFGKLFIKFSRLLNLGSGSTWPGHIALNLNPNFIKDILKESKTKIVIVVGTNGKTTTGKLITQVIRTEGKSVIENAAGANLLNGLASALINGSSLGGRLNRDYLVFECDEYALPQVIAQTKPDFAICLNLFRDQLDRYGEIDSIAKKWHESFKKLTSKTILILNADDPQISYLSKGSKSKVLYFGLSQNGQTQTKHGADSIYCPKCSSKLEYSSVFFSHLGDWECPKCGLKRPEINISNIIVHPLVGTYNKYNALAAYLFAKQEKINQNIIERAFKNFTPAFGRQEKVIYKGHEIQIFLSKNPTSFNESLQTIKAMGGKNLLILLNDRIPDGLDVSWIWDINFEEILEKDLNIAVSGDRVYDMALRLKYASLFTHVEKNFEKALNKMIEALDISETLYILPNYSAMLDLRKTLTGRKIL